MFLLSSWVCYAQEGEGVPIARQPTIDPNDPPHPSSGDQNPPATSSATTSPREGDTIWLEEKIAPPTRWIESLVKPLTNWMERTVQNPASSLEETTLNSWVRPEAPVTTDREATDASEAPEAPILTSAEAAAIARQAVQGEVLRIKLISGHSQVPVYRIKLITDKGEIQLLHIDSHNGALVPTTKPTDNNPSD